MLELGAFPVKTAEFGPQTRFADGALEIDRDEVLRLVLQDPGIRWADVSIVRPGDSARIINEYDTIEPRVKVSGGGVAYPALVGRSPRAVGVGRTHRLSGLALTGCVDASEVRPDDPGQRARADTTMLTNYKFVDMSGPGAVTFNASAIHVCVTMAPDPGLSSEARNGAVQGALLRVSDLLAATTLGQTPPEVEVFDNSPVEGLPGIVSICHLSSLELYRGPYTKMGTAVYGITRAAPPWVLEPMELLDGAIAQMRTRLYTNNPLNLELLRRHGRDWNYLACLAYPTNWSMQSEKEAVSWRVARTAQMLGADGAVVTTDVRGQRMVETMLTIQACEQVGVKTVFLSEEEDPEGGEAPAFLTFVPELEAIVSTGTGGWDGPFPAVERVIGARAPESRWYAEQPPVHGRYAVSHLGDHYGYGKQSYADY